eukprot:GILJ01000705.1.p1 GENE.GILJ01000705.1~~GILJ01000705.1.p1  ORF type:complete len:273 (-),score=18.64 GILJ01000705.1:297-1034(-)
MEHNPFRFAQLSLMEANSLAAFTQTANAYPSWFHHASAAPFGLMIQPMNFANRSPSLPQFRPNELDWLSHLHTLFGGNHLSLPVPTPRSRGSLQTKAMNFNIETFANFPHISNVENFSPRVISSFDTLPSKRQHNSAFQPVETRMASAPSPAAKTIDTAERNYRNLEKRGKRVWLRIPRDVRCAKCGVTESSRWRLGENNARVCNACGLMHRKLLRSKKLSDMRKPAKLPAAGFKRESSDSDLSV